MTHQDIQKWIQNRTEMIEIYLVGGFCLLCLMISQPSALTISLGVLGSATGMLFRIYCLSWNKSLEGKETISPFHLMKHPVMIANMLILASLALYTASFWFFVISLGVFATYYAVSAPQDNQLPWLPKDWQDLQSLDWPPGGMAWKVSRLETLALVAMWLLLALTA